LKERAGSSLQGIKKALNATPAQYRFINAALKAGVKSGFFVKNKGKFKLSAAAKKPPAKKKKKAKKKVKKKKKKAKKKKTTSRSAPEPNGVSSSDEDEKLPQPDSTSPMKELIEYVKKNRYNITLSGRGRTKAVILQDILDLEAEDEEDEEDEEDTVQIDVKEITLADGSVYDVDDNGNLYPLDSNDIVGTWDKKNNSLKPLE
jgi:hypothetical protein